MLTSRAAPAAAVQAEAADDISASAGERLRWIALSAVPSGLVIACHRRPGRRTEPTGDIGIRLADPIRGQGRPKTARWPFDVGVPSFLEMDDHDSLFGPTPLARSSHTSLPVLSSMHSAMPGVSRT